MTSDPTVAPLVSVKLQAAMFATTETLLLETANTRVSGFRYRSGVEALRIATDRVEVIVLPFRGQQIWRYAVDGEDLTMRTHFDEPARSALFGETYGAFMLHCGLSGIGHPSALDTHAHHGELPNAHFDAAELQISSADGRDMIGLTGSYRLRVSHSADVIFRPLLTLHSDATTLALDVRISNQRLTPFTYSYLCHVNWPVFDQGTLIQTLRMDPGHFELAPDPNQDEATAAYTHDIEQSLPESNSLSLDRMIIPEYCAILRPSSDQEGWCHFVMTRPDGKAAAVSYESAELPYAIRWISNTGDEVAAGFCLPSTAHHRGRLAAEAGGMMRRIPGGGSVSMKILIDLLDPAAAKDRIALIDAVNGAGASA